MPHALTTESSVDVLVIGAGPAGLFAAHALARYGIDVRVIDQRPEKVAAGQADGIQPRTIEVLQSFGLAERLMREGTQIHMAAFYNPGPDGGIVRSGRAPDITAPTARYPFKILRNQGGIEQIFLDSMEPLGVHIERPIQPSALEWSQDEKEIESPDSFPVRVTLKRLDARPDAVNTEIVHAKFVIGADGAHSWTRKALGFHMEGEQSEYIWGVVDTIPVTNFPDIRNQCAIHSSNGSIMVIPREGDQVRLYIQLTDDVAANGGRVDRAKWSVERLLASAKKSLAPFEIDFPNPIEWWTIYIIGQRVASSFSMKERVFIVGDACHTHSPKAGQGMNASMNDSHNLSWKITSVLRGWTSREILKTYEFERRKYAQELIAFDRKYSALFSGKAHSETNADGVTHEMFLEAFQSFGGFTSGVGIHYSPSMIVDAKHQDVASKLVIGERMIPQVVIRAADYRPYNIQDLLPSDMRYKIFVFTGDTSDKAQLAKVVDLSEKLAGKKGILRRYTKSEQKDVFDIISVSSEHGGTMDYTCIPEVLRTHWSKVFIDDIDLQGVEGGKAYCTYGIGRDGGIVVVRPDGYVGAMAPLDQLEDIDKYFSGILIQTV